MRDQSITPGEGTKRLRLPRVPRHDEEAILQEALQDVLQKRSVQVVLVGGHSGTGKQTLVEHALQSKQLTKNKFFHATTKFDQRQTKAPLAGLRQLLTDLMKSSFQRAGRGGCCAVVGKKLTKAQVGVLKGFATAAGLMPSDDDSCRAFEAATVAVEGETSSGEELKEVDREDTKDDANSSESVSSTATDVNMDEISKDGLTVLTTTLKAFIEAIASVAPVLLQLEDIHWSCETTMEVLERIVTSSTVENLCVIATFRTDEETANPKFDGWKNNLQKHFQGKDSNEPESTTVNTNTVDPATPRNKSNLHILDLDNLELSHVEELLAEATSREISDITDLAEVVFKFTHGNLFFLRHFLEKLQDDGFLVFNQLCFRWEWDVETIKRRSSISSNVVQVLASRLHNLPQAVQNVLMLAACFGNQFDVRALEAAKTAFDDISCVETCLQKAVEQEFIIPLSSSQSDSSKTPTHYRFSHDMIQLTAYGLLPEEVELGKVHWDIGCLLFKNGKHLWEADDAILFSTVDHLNIGVDWMEAPTVTSGGACLTKKWRIEIAKINYKAAVKAASLSAFYPSASYLEAAIKALGGSDDPAFAFQMCYGMALQVFSLYAKTKYCVGHIEASRNAANQVLEHASNYSEKLTAVTILLQGYVADNDPSKLLDFCSTMLAAMGETLYKNPSNVYVQLEYQKMKHRLNSLSDEDILALPNMTNAEMEIILMVLCQQIFPLYHYEHTGESTLVTCRMVQLTLKYGICESSAEAFAMAATTFAGISHDIKASYRLGRLAEQIVRTRLGGMTARTAQVMSTIALGSKWWFEPVSNCLDICIENHRLCMQSGQVGAAFQASMNYITTYFYTGLPLESLLQDVEKYARLFLDYNHKIYFLLSLPLWQCCKFLDVRRQCFINVRTDLSFAWVHSTQCST